MLRGINKQRIFEDDQDYQKFLETIKTHKEASGYKIYAYCLMSNHIHLLMKEGRESLGIALRRIGASYVYWYNWKYSRRGHLFQDRYKSGAVETDGYFLTVLRYIHQRITIVKIPTKIQTFEKQKRNAVIKKLKNRGLSIRQISRLTGISFGVIRGI